MLRDGARQLFDTLHTAARAVAATAVILLAMGHGFALYGERCAVFPIPAFDGGGLIALYAGVCPEPGRADAGSLVVRLGYEEVRRDRDRWREAGGGHLTLAIPAPAALLDWIKAAGS